MLAPCRSFDLGKKASITDIIKFQKNEKPASLPKAISS